MIENEMENLPEVSVICIAYNQEKVISRCLDGFVNQKTDFKYEHSSNMSRGDLKKF